MMTASVDFDVQISVEAAAPQLPVEPIAGDAVETFSQAMEQPKPETETGFAAFGEAVKAFAETAFAAEGAQLTPETALAETPVAKDGSRPVRAAETGAEVASAGTPVAKDGSRPIRAAETAAEVASAETPVAKVGNRPIRDDEDAAEVADRVVASGVAPQQVPAAPVRADAPEQVAHTGTSAADAVEAVGRAAKAAAPADVLVRAAEEVADAILVSPGLLRGEGEIRIQLKPDVLDGSEVRISVEGRQLGVELLPVAADTAAFIERNLPQLQQMLSARVHAFTVGVSMRRNRVGRA